MKIFGVVNASPDTLAEFSIVHDAESARARGKALLDAGASYLDIGAEGSSGTASSVSPETEWERLTEPLSGLLSLGVDVSIDTRHAEIARRALKQGAAVLNAGDALQSDEMLRVAADFDVPVVLPFMLGSDFRNMRKPVGDSTGDSADGSTDDSNNGHLDGRAQNDPVELMLDWFDNQLQRLQPFGVVDRLLLDLGIGFGPADWDWPSRSAYQKAIYEGLDRFQQFNLPLYVPVAWKQTPDRLEIMDIALATQPEYVRAHRPSQVLARSAALLSGNPLPTDQLATSHV